MDFQKLLLDPKGRIGQKNYWIGVAILLGGNIILGGIPFIGWMIWILLVFCGVCVYGKRLHDAGRSAWLHAIPWAVTLLLGLIAVMIGGAAVISMIMAGDHLSDKQALVHVGGAMFGALSVSSLGLVVWIAYTLWVGLLPSQAGDNAYGPQPSSEDEVFSPVSHARSNGQTVDGEAVDVTGQSSTSSSADPKTPS
ncbi:DUF805 domain-containing protein [Woodsholea maritima]|uniref:DUF805 domain-containing protein n=1 Tax=Woodsholea maritima TaxID=240237 RepID=UPI000379AA94|nr:DUF805 domain-containing protein [Woodsholea maritima]